MSKSKNPDFCFAGLTGTVYGRLQDSGYFFDPVQREVEQQVMPWLKEETDKIVARHATARYAYHLSFLCAGSILHFVIDLTRC